MQMRDTGDSLTSDERDQRLKQIQELLSLNLPAVDRLKPEYAEAIKHLDFALSLLDSQEYEVNEVDAERLADYHKIGSIPAIVKSVDHGATTLAECVEKTIDRFYKLGHEDGSKSAATSMRDLCVEKVKAHDLCLADGCELIQELQSLTLEQEQK